MASDNPEIQLRPLVVSMAEAGVLLNSGVDKLYELIHAEELDSYLEGTRRKITMASIERLIVRRLAAKRGKLDRSQLVERRLATRRAQARTRRGRVSAAERGSAA
jgi:hypothetical protein